MRSLSLLAACAMACLLSGCASYKFGLDRESHPYAFSDDEDTRSPLRLKSVNNIALDLAGGRETIYIEHLVPVSIKDREKIDGIPFGMHLLFGMTFPQAASSIRSVKVRNSYRGRPVEEFASFINKGLGHITRETLVAQPTDSIRESGGFSVIKIFGSPSGGRYWLPRAWYFPEPLKQEIVIESEHGDIRKTVVLSFTLEWFKRYNSWQVIDHFMVSV